MGDDTINVVTKNRPRFMPWANWSRQSEAEHPHRRPLMLPQEIARMDRTEQIVLRAGMMPMKTGRPYWRDDASFKARWRPAPEIPRLNVTIDLDDGSTQIKRPSERQKPITAADVEPLPEDVDVW